MPRQPLCEVFGFPIANFSSEAARHRQGKLCPYHNIVPRCTKASVEDPLGVCSIYSQNAPIIICPVRFRQEIAHDGQPDESIYTLAKEFLLPAATSWDYVTEATLQDGDGKSIGDIDVVLVEYNQDHKVTDFGVLEIQSVYISGNVRRSFVDYQTALAQGKPFSWAGPHYPRPDWLSSIKRLVRQLTVKGFIFNAWKKRMAVVCQRQFFDQIGFLDNPPIIPQDEADLAWFLYDLIPDPQTGLFKLQLEKTIYMTFRFAMDRLSSLKVGDISQFTAVLDRKLASKHRSKP